MFALSIMLLIGLGLSIVAYRDLFVTKIKMSHAARGRAYGMLLVEGILVVGFIILLFKEDRF